MVPIDTTQRAVSGLFIVLVLICTGVMAAHAQELRTQNLLLDDDASSTGTRNTITLRAPLDATLNANYSLRFPDANGLGASALLFVEDYTAPVATTRWLTATAGSVLTTNASNQLVWQSLSSLLAEGEWADGDSIGLSGLIYARQALENGSADTLAITDDGDFGLGTTTPDALLTLQGSGDLFRAKDAGGTLRSVLDDDGQHDWYLGTFTGEVGQARVGTTSGFPSFSLFRPGSTDRFDILNRSLYTGLGYSADGVDTGGVLNIVQGGNIGIGIAAPTAKLHVSATVDPLRAEGIDMDLTLDSVLVLDGQGVFHWIPADSLVAQVIDSTLVDIAWLVEGNSGTTDGTEFVGTTDSVPLNLRVNNARAFRIEPTSSVPNILAGPSSNTVSGGAIGVTISGGSANDVAANYGVIGGGRNNLASGVDATVGGGQRNTASAIDATVAGGEDNVASGDISTVGGGDENSATSYAATVGGGESNTASGNYATLNGGEDNVASAHYSTVGGGWQDTATGYASTIAGGDNNNVSGSRATVGGGQENNASGSRAVVSGGQNNLASDGYTTVSGGFNDSATGYASTVSGGEFNVAAGSRATISGGGENSASANYSFVGGGLDNSIDGVFSAVPGGRGLTLSGEGSFGFLGANNAGTNNMTLSVDDVATFGNTDLWLANNNNSASALFFYEANSTAGAFPVATNYSSFEAQAQGADIRYLLPDTAGITGDVLTVGSVTGTTIALDWASSGGGGNAWLLTGNSGTTAGTDFLGTTDNQAFEIHVNSQRALRIDPRSASPNITAGYSGNTIPTNEDGNVIAGGGASGQINETGTGVDFGVVGGGRDNGILDNADYAVISGGEDNQMESDADWTAIVGGRDNTINSDGDYSTIAGGRGLTLGGSGSFGFLGGNNAGTNGMTVTDDNIAILGNVDLWLGNNNNNATEIRFYEPIGSTGAFPGTFEYTSFEAQAQASDIRYLLPDAAGVAGEFLSIASVSGTTVTLEWDATSGGGGNAWLLTGNSGTSIGTNFLGTTDDEALDIRVNNQRVMRYEPNSVSPHVIGGYSGNTVALSEEGNVIAGGGQSGAINETGFGVDFGVIGGGRGNRIDNSADYTVIVGGEDNILDEESDWAVIGGGRDNQITDTTLYSTLAGGRANAISNNANYGVISGGRDNAINGEYSAIPGGYGFTLSGNRSFGFHANNAAGTQPMTVTADATVLFGNADLWLANNNNDATQLRFYEPESGTGAFPSATQYSSFEARSQSADINYILPDTAGTLGDVLTVGAVAGSTITLDWAAALGGNDAWLLTGNSGTTAGTDFLGTTDNEPFEIHVNSQRALRISPRTASPNILGGYSGNSIVATEDGNVISGGGSSTGINEIGNGVDYGTIGGGRGNQILDNSDYATISGGDDNRIDGNSDNATVVGGDDNVIDASDFSVIGGEDNTITSSTNAVIGGGEDNTINTGEHSVIVGGDNNTVSAELAVVGGGFFNTATADYGWVGGGAYNNATGTYSAVPGGERLTLGANSFGFNNALTTTQTNLSSF